MTDAFDRFIGRNNPPLVVVTTMADGERAGCLVGFHAQASIEPELYAVWLSRANRTMQVAARADRLAVHYLDHAQRQVAQHFGALTGDETDKFGSIGWSPGPHGLPLLDACPNRLILRRVELIDIGHADHVCWLGSIETVAMDIRADDPLRLGAMSGLTPGHEADDD